MLTQELTSLAGTGAATLVAAMTTDAWQAARSGIARLFAHAGESRQKAAEAQLDTNAMLVTRASDPDQARRNVAGLWQVELATLLEEHPGIADELRALNTHIASALPASGQSWVQNITARDGGISIGVQGGGNVFVHNASTPATPGLGVDADGSGGFGA